MSLRRPETGTRDCSRFRGARRAPVLGCCRDFVKRRQRLTHANQFAAAAVSLFVARIRTAMKDTSQPHYTICVIDCANAVIFSTTHTFAAASQASDNSGKELSNPQPLVAALSQNPLTRIHTSMRGTLS